MNNTSEHCIKICNGLLRGERSAVETYGLAIEKHATTVAAAELARIRAEHIAAVNQLTTNVRSMGGEPETDSGAWGIFAKAVQATSNLFGPGSALESLQRGEASGKADYESALADDQVMPACKNMIRDELLPLTIRHISALDQLALRV
jgi:uncharacterized protein (TIGR02284 family)